MLDAGALLIGKATLHEIGAQRMGCHQGFAGPAPAVVQQRSLKATAGTAAEASAEFACSCPSSAGLGTTGLNLVTGTARNPHSTAHHTGGSSSGSAALVAAGLCPFALGGFC
jgi:Asp-tRNA(Asn)/Glu-tRNA(Gln) amidotransferase A subunit family amidase